MKRIITIQDISCVGKCSLTVALPVISAMGIEACPLPTALLSNHTAFDTFEFFDLTDKMKDITAAFKQQGFRFDGIYSAYLGSKSQVDIVKELIDSFKAPDTLVLIDPVMGDHGRLYSGFDSDFPLIMSKLCKKADIIVPNTTEAGFLLGLNGALSYSSQDEVKAALKALCANGPEICVLTGYEEGDRLGAAAYNSATGEFYTYLRKKIDRTFHGTGDLFASVLFSCLMRGATLKKALHGAVDITYEAMTATLNSEHARWYGVDFEAVIPTLCALAKEIT